MPAPTFGCAMKIYLSTFTVPFGATVFAIGEFTSDSNGDAAALAFVNTALLDWAENHGIKVEAFESLNYALATVEGYDGEIGFTAMCGEADLGGVIERHYTRTFGARANWPGYLRAALGDDVQAEIAEVHAYYGKPHN